MKNKQIGFIVSILSLGYFAGFLYSLLYRLLVDGLYFSRPVNFFVVDLVLAIIYGIASYFLLKNKVILIRNEIQTFIYTLLNLSLISVVEGYLINKEINLFYIHPLDYLILFMVVYISKINSFKYSNSLLQFDLIKENFIRFLRFQIGVIILYLIIRVLVSVLI